MQREENGVPQGSVLAVTLFLIGINDVFRHLPKGIYILIYADDIVLLASGQNARRTKTKLQTAMRKVTEWADKVGFSMAAEKSVTTHICKHLHHPWRQKITVGGTTVPFRKTAKIIGVTFDRKLSFKPHFAKVKAEAQSRGRLIKTISSRHNNGNRQSLLQVGNSVITSKLLYGTEITARVFNDMVAALGPTYNKMIRNCSGLLPSTPALSSCIEAGVLPFDAMVASSTIRKTVSFLEKTDGNYDPTSAVTEQIYEAFSSIACPPIARLHTVWDRRWNHKGPIIDWDIKKSLKAGDPPQKATAVFNEILNRKYNNYEVIYTDGSKCDTTVGIGITGNNQGIFYKLPGICSIFSAEAAAMHTALARHTTNTKKSIVLFTDSASVLAALEKGSLKHPWIQAIENICDERTTLCWIPGHCGINGNHEADRLAALGRRSTLLTNEVPGTDIKQDIERRIRTEVESKWRIERNLFLRKIKGNLTRWDDRASRKEQQIFSRLRTGHTMLTHKGLFQGGNRTDCRTCNVALTVEHLLTRCPEYKELRERYQIGDSIRDALSNDPVKEEKLICFLKDAQLYNQI
ncbi:uncharacterized protein LOC131679600 [Topomyia yanbarensis]|uniref:uncharacterized protein LOC131679600 n=1 Tax=Topomyia yanbarensis TaxID=2498891 RepID=UPI00273AB812|nr:uncharacterized protein LOC131679600 [Topomyia yanbarensis]